MNTKHFITLLIHAFAGWLLCFAIMGLGLALWPLDVALIVHAIAAPIFFACVSAVYFKKFNYTAPLVTAICFTVFVIVVDFFVVALLINRSLEMFTSLIGTWIPFLLIFASTYVTGLWATKKVEAVRRSQG